MVEYHCRRIGISFTLKIQRVGLGLFDGNVGVDILAAGDAVEKEIGKHADNEPIGGHISG